MLRSWLFLCIFLFSFSPSNTEAYTYMKGNPKWSFSQMPIPWYVTYTDAANWGGRDLLTIKKIVEGAFGIWEGLDCSFIMFKYMGTTKVGGIKGDGKNVIEWVATLPDGATASAVGLGGPIWGGGGAVKEGNVWLKAGTRSDQSQMMILTHEVGHAIGIGHTDVSNAIMAPAYNKNTHLTDDDTKAVCGAYPISTNTCTETAQCPKGLVCNGGRCGKCGSDGDCQEKHYCDRGACYPSCEKDDDCDPKGRLCKDSRCTVCKSDDDCGTGRFCEQDLCKNKCKVDDDCGAGSECRENGRCVKRGGCLKNEDCRTGEYCQSGNCLSQGSLGKICEGANNCADGQECVIHDCKVDLDCNEGYTCDTTAKACIKPANKEDKASICSILCKDKGKDIPCPGGFVCKEYGPDRSYCYPETRKEKPKEEPKKETGGGCGCSAQPSNTPPISGLFALLLWGLLLLLGQRKRRAILAPFTRHKHDNL